ncbi:Rab geranylgeranyltransferase [Pseudogymnoascus australis]
MTSHGVPRIAATAVRTEQQRQDEIVKIEKYQALVDLIETKIQEHEYTLEVLALTSKLLTKNPEYYTIWNVRRRLLTSGLFSKSSDGPSPSTQQPSTSQAKTTNLPSENPRPQNPGSNGTTLELIKDDLSFLVPLLKQWPKCYWIWNHRIWLLQQATLRLDVPVARRLWEEELGLCNYMLVRDSRNFHGWGYRRMVIEKLESPSLNGKSLVEEEFTYTTKMVNANLSNFSAWHNRSQLIPRLLDERNASDEARKEFLDEEFDTMRNALWTDASDQSLWFYHQFLMVTLLDQTVSILPNFTTEQRIDYANSQIDDLKEMLDGAEDCKWIYNGLYEYTLAICRTCERQPTADELQDLKSWLGELKKLDPVRMGRWEEQERSLNH